MTKNNFLLVAILLIAFHNISAQSYFGFRIEPVFYSVNIEKTVYNPTSTKDEKSFLTNVAVTFSFSTQIAEKLKLGFRPSLIMGPFLSEDLFDRLYNGIEGGFFANYSISDKQYLLLGVNSHIEFAGGGHTYSNDNVFLPYIVLGAGHFTSKNFTMELQFCYPLKKEVYGTYRDLGIGPSYITTWNNYQVEWMIKFGLGFEWEL